MDKAQWVVGVCGFGGLGHVHAESLAAMPDVEVAAVCDIDPARLAAPATETNLGSAGARFDIRRCRTYTDLGALLAAERLDVLVLALPTDLHAPMAIRALRAGCAVFCEKPMAISAAAATRMIAASRATGRPLMIGQCLRFWSEYELLRAMIADGRHGRLLTLNLERAGAYPHWSSWFLNETRSGGAILDLHMHDVDWCLHALGAPTTLQAAGRRGRSGGIDEVTALWDYADGPLVTLHGSWLGAGFAMGFRAVFEQAQVDFGAVPGGGLRVKPKGDGETQTVPGDGQSAYAKELRYFLECVRDGRPVTRCPPEETRLAVRLVELEQRAVASGRRLRLPAAPRAGAAS